MMKRRAPGSRKAQSELISAMLLIAVTLAVALAAYGYFLTRASAEAKTQSIKSAINSARSELLVTVDFHYKPAATIDTYYVAIRNIKASSYTFYFAVVAVEESGEYIAVTDPDIATVYLLLPDDGVYEEQLLAPSYIVPTSRIYVDLYRELFSRTQINIEIYNATGTTIPGETGCEVLVRLDVSRPTSGSPTLLLLINIGNAFYLVDSYTLPGG